MLRRICSTCTTCSTVPGGTNIVRIGRAARVAIRGVLRYNLTFVAGASEKATRPVGAESNGQVKSDVEMPFFFGYPISPLVGTR